MTSFRGLSENDDRLRIASGIYETDRLLFDLLFGNKSYSVDAISRMIDSSYINEYHKSFITVVYDRNPDLVEGFVVSYPGRALSLESTFLALEETKRASLESIFLNRILEIFFSSRTGARDYYIGNLYVYDEFRHKGLGSKLVEKAKQKARIKNMRYVKADVEYDKKNLLDFYGKLGFKNDSENYHKILGNTYGCYGLKYEI